MAEDLMEVEGLDTESWLRSHGLGHLFVKFDEAAFSVEDLMSCNEESVKYVDVYIIGVI